MGKSQCILSRNQESSQSRNPPRILSDWKPPTLGKPASSMKKPKFWIGRKAVWSTDRLGVYPALYPMIEPGMNADS